VMELRTPLTSRPAQASVRALLGLWVLAALLLPMAPALAQDSQPDTKEQPASSTPGTSAPAEKDGSPAPGSLEELRKWGSRPLAGGSGGRGSR
jgi:hypothetical protein